MQCMNISKSWRLSQKSHQILQHGFARGMYINHCVHRRMNARHDCVSADRNATRSGFDVVKSQKQTNCRSSRPISRNPDSWLQSSRYVLQIFREPMRFEWGGARVPQMPGKFRRSHAPRTENFAGREEKSVHSFHGGESVGGRRFYEERASAETTAPGGSDHGIWAWGKTLGLPPPCRSRLPVGLGALRLIKVQSIAMSIWTNPL